MFSFPLRLKKVISQGTIYTGTRGCAKSAMGGWFTQYSHNEEFKPKLRHLLATLPVLPNEWKIRLKLKLKPASLGWRSSPNVIHLTNRRRENNWEGVSILNIWVHGQSGVRISVSGVNEQHFSKYFGEFNGKLAKKLDKGEEWVAIEISQEFTPEMKYSLFTRPKKLMYRVTIDGVKELSVENKTPQFFENVNLYTHYGSELNGRIKELSIQIKEDDLIKSRLTKIKTHYLKKPPPGQF